MAITQPGLRRTQEVRYGATGQDLYADAEVDGATATPTVTTVSLFKPGASTAEVSAAVTTVSGSRMTYTLDASNTTTWPLDENYVAEFTFTASSVVRVIRRLFDVVRIPILHHPPLRIDDLKNLHKSVDAALSQLSITDGHQRWILPAWEDCCAFVEANGWRPALITSPEVLVRMLRARAGQLMFRALKSTGNELYGKIEEDLGKEYEEAKHTTVLRYDPADGRSTSAIRNFQQPQLLVGPDLWTERATGTLGTPYSVTWVKP